MSQTNTTTPANRPGPLADGETIAVEAGSVIVVVQCVRPGAAYRFAVRNTDGFEIEELSRSFAFEGTARRAARTAVILFRSGFTVREVIAMCLAIREVAR